MQSRVPLLVGTALALALGGLLAGCGGGTTTATAPADQVTLNVAILSDIVNKKTIGGALHSERGQMLCFDPSDLMKYKNGIADPETEGANAAKINDAFDAKLFSEGRCGASAPGATFDVTSDGRERFTTPSGTAELWFAD